MQLAFEFDTEPEWVPLFNTATPTEVERGTGRSILPASYFARIQCRDCGQTGNNSRSCGGAGGGLSWQVCDPCTELDGCLTRVHVSGPEWHVSLWGRRHHATDHDGLVAEREKRRNAWRRRAARSTGEGSL